MSKENDRTVRREVAGNLERLRQAMRDAQLALIESRIKLRLLNTHTRNEQ